jgi:hypothetical protein
LDHALADAERLGYLASLMSSQQRSTTAARIRLVPRAGEASTDDGFVRAKAAADGLSPAF